MSKDKTIVEKIHEYSLEEIMGERFGKYSKYIIQDRALPDARDGLKPVQRRILYSMYKEKNTYDKETKKSAKTVGDVMGKYHPHGDSSIYEAMVRMSQKWKQRHILIDMQGNNGSIDGDPAAAMRYTEARLSKISGVLLQDIEKNSVLMAPTFDDTSLEPTVLPAHFPNLLVNGSTGISAGYATNIPPHNLGEIIDATIKRIDSPNSRMDTILEIVKGPDFPTGGIVEGKNGIIEAYTTGRGKVIVRSKYEFVSVKDKEKIVITEIPYDVLKSSILKKIEEIRIDKKIDGMLEVRDESDKNNDLKIVIDLKKDVNKELIINYLLKNTELQINYAFNMVAIVNRRPKTLGLLELLDAFVAHKKEVVTLRTKFDLDASLHSMHIVEGFIKALDILDEIVALIRRSKNKADAIENLMKEYEFSKIQAEAIVNMQLYKLTNTDVTLLKEEYERLKILIARLREILDNEEELKGVMKDELREIRKEYATPRITQIKEEITEIKIEETDMVSKEDYIVCISKSGYIKKVSIKSYNASNEEETTLKEGDYLEGLYKVNNLDTILIFTNMGNYLYLPVYQIEEFKYKDLGYHVSNIVAISDGEKVIKSMAVNKFDNSYVTAFTKLGMVKRMYLDSFQVTRYSKPISMFKMKDKDEVVGISIVNSPSTIIITKNGFALRFNTEEIPVVGLKTSGVKAIKLSDGDEIVNAYVYGASKEHLTVFTDKNTSKRVKLEDIPVISRAKKGVVIIKSPKSKAYKVINAFCSGSKTIFGYITDKTNILKSSEINIMDRNSVGSAISKSDINSIFIVTKLKTLEKEDMPKDEVIVEEVKKEETKEEKQKEKVIENLTMSDFFDEFKL